MCMPSAPKIAAPPPPPPVPTPADPAVAEAKEKNRLAQRQRKGRAANILTDQGEGGLGNATISRPEARGAQLLGQSGI